MERYLIPVRLPKWLHSALVGVKRIFVPPAASPSPKIDIGGERNVEWSFLSAEMPSGPGEALEFGCENGYMSLVAAEKGYHVLANDLEEQSFSWSHPSVEFRKGDFLTLPLPASHFDLLINCSSVEHVGVPGRYGISSKQENGDIEVMNRFAEVLKPGGMLMMTAPCGRDAVMAPWCRVYGPDRLPKLFSRFEVVKENYWIKSVNNQWVRCERASALDFQPVQDLSNPHGCAYTLGGFILRKK